MSFSHHLLGATRRRTGAAVLAALLLAPTSVLATPAGAEGTAPATELTFPYVRALVSADPAGNAAAAPSWGPSISEDGASVVFSSEADLTATPGGYGTIYLAEHGDTRTLPVELEEDGEQYTVPLHGDHPVISGDGAKVAYSAPRESEETPVEIAGTTAFAAAAEGSVLPTYEVGVYDIATGDIATVTPAVPASYIGAPAVSDDGTVVAFSADVDATEAQDWKVFVGTAGGTAEAVGDAGDAQAPVAVALSGDGSRVAWHAFDDAGGKAAEQAWSLRARDLTSTSAPAVEVAGVDRSEYVGATGGSTYGRIQLTDDGDTLVAAVVADHLFRLRKFDLSGDEVTFSDYGPWRDNPTFFDQVSDPAINADGSIVAFATYSSVEAESSGMAPRQVFVWNETTRTMSVATADPGQDPTCAQDMCHETGHAALSADGAVLVFESDLSSLVSGDDNGVTDVFSATVGKLSDPPAWADTDALTVSGVTDRAATLGWPAATDDVGVAGYRLYLLPAEGNPMLWTSTGPEERSYDLQFLSPGVEWTFGVRARDAQGQLSAMRTVTFRTLPAPADGGGEEPPPPVLATLELTPLAGDGVELSWPPSSDAGVTGYQVVRTPQGGDAEILESTLGPDATSYRDVSGVAGTIYQYRIDAIKGTTTTPHTLPGGYQFPFLHVDTTNWSLPADDYGLIAPGATAQLEVRGSGNRTATATVEYISAADKATIVEVPVVEQAEKGLYQATWTLPEGVRQVDGVAFRLSQAEGDPIVQAVSGSFPMAIASAVTLDADLPTDVPASVLAGATLSIYDYSTWGGRTFTLTGAEGPLGLLAASDRYEARLFDAAGNEMARDRGFEVQAGTTAVLDLSPRRPAQLEVSVRDTEGDEVPGASVIVTDRNDPTFARSAWVWDSTAVVHGLRESQELDVTVRRTTGSPYEAESTTSLPPLAAGENQATTMLPKLPRAIVTGRVRASHEETAGLPWAYVTATQVVDGQTFSYSTSADRTGAFSLDVLQGTLDVSASTWRDPQVRIEGIAVGAGGAEVDIPVVTARPMRFDVVLSTQLDPKKPLTDIEQINWRDAVHYGLFGSGPSGHIAITSQNMTVQGRPGDVIKLCANGWEAGLGSSCVQVPLGDPDADGYTVPVGRIELTKLAEVKGTITAPEDTTYVRAVLSKVEDGGSRVVETKWVPPGPYSFALPGAGTYRLELSDYYRNNGPRAADTFTVGANEIYDDADFTLREPAGSLDMDGETSVVAVSPVVVPGGIAEFRTSLEVQEAVQDAAVALEVPLGTTLVPKSVLLDGKPVAVTPGDAREVRVELGDLEPGEVHVIRHRVLLNDTVAGGTRVQAESELVDADGREAVGRAQVLVEPVTLIAPERTASRSLLLSGRAPAGSPVDLYAGAALLGQAVAGPGGLWRHQVELPDVGRTGRYQLRAEITQGTTTHATRPRAVQFDGSQPRLLSLSLGQEPEGRNVVINDPQNGIAPFPYVFVPGQPTVVKLTFDNPAAVENVVLTIGTDRAEAVLENGKWVARITTHRLGAIDLTWDIVASAPTAQEILTSEQVRNRLPVGLSTFTEPKKQPIASLDHNTVSADFEDAGLDMDVEVTVEDAPADYEPSAAEQAKAKKDGHPVYDVEWDFDDEHEPDSGKALESTVTMYVPASELEEGDSLQAMGFKAASASGSFKAQGLFGAMKKVTTKLEVGGAEDAYKAATQTSDLQQAAGAGDKYARMEKLRRWAEQCPQNGVENITREDVLERLQRFAEHGAPAADATAAGLSAGGLAVDPGPGKNPFIFLLQLAAGAIQDRGIGDQFDQMEERLKSADCPEPPDDDGGDGDGSGGSSTGGGSGDGGGSGGGGVHVPAAPIYDPSGYVYEGFPANRLEGVTSTILYRTSEDDLTPEVWDAGWYGQENPHLTDGAGRYGWDVPEGWWQVVWTKDGYETGYSAILEVLPPRLDVNHGMVSTQAPAVQSVAATASAVEVVFDKPMLTESVKDRVAVSKGGQPVAGTVSAVGGATVGADQLATTFRFVPAVAFAGSSELGIAIQREAQGYNRRSLAAGWQGTRTVPAAVTPPTGGGGGGGGMSPSPTRVSVPAPAPGQPARALVTTPNGVVELVLEGASGGEIVVTVAPAGQVGGLVLLGTAFNVSSTSSFTRATVCFPYQEAEVTAAGMTEGELSLFHGRADGTYEDVTASVDQAANRICGSTTSFSPFAIGRSRSTRVAGADRYATAAAISARSFDPGVPVAYVASGSAFADALAAGPVAARAGAPILLTAAASVPPATAAELGRLRPGRIVVVGGSAVVSAAVFSELDAFTDGAVERIAGPDRYATAALLAERAYSSAEVVYVATGTTFPDALVAGPVLVKEGAPLLLVAPGQEGPATAQLRRLRPKRVIVLGGVDAVTAAQASALASAAAGATVQRLSGEDRYETASVLARRIGSAAVYLATGEDFADALAAVPVAGTTGAAIVLVRRDGVPAASRALLEAVRPSSMTVLGGTGVLTRAVELAAARTMDG